MNKCNDHIKYDVIIKAVDGDPTSINMVLHHYKRYIYKLAMSKTVNEYGEEKYVPDPYMASVLENHLISGILNFDIDKYT